MLTGAKKRDRIITFEVFDQLKFSGRPSCSLEKAPFCNEILIFTQQNNREEEAFLDLPLRFFSFARPEKLNNFMQPNRQQQNRKSTKRAIDSLFIIKSCKKTGTRLKIQLPFPKDYEYPDHTQQLRPVPAANALNRKRKK